MEYRLMWDAYYKLPDDDAAVVTNAASRLAALTDLSFTEALYTFWKMGIYFAENPGVIG